MEKENLISSSTSENEMLKVRWWNAYANIVHEAFVTLWYSSTTGRNVENGEVWMRWIAEKAKCLQCSSFSWHNVIFHKGIFEGCCNYQCKIGREDGCSSEMFGAGKPDASGWNEDPQKSTREEDFCDGRDGEHSKKVKCQKTNKWLPCIWIS